MLSFLPPPSSGPRADRGAGCLRHRRGARGPREAGAALGPQEDQAGRHGGALPTGDHLYNTSSIMCIATIMLIKLAEVKPLCEKNP